jgi:hypothetical protein
VGGPVPLQNTSVSKAKQAISDYKRAVSDPEGFSREVNHHDASYFDVLVSMFERALEATNMPELAPILSFLQRTLSMQ